MRRASIIFSHPTGNANVRAAATALDEAGLLAEFWTCIAWSPGDWRERWLPRRLVTELHRRALPAALASKTQAAPWREAGRLLAGRLGWRGLIQHETGVFSIDAIFRDLDERVARRVSAGRAVAAVYAYEDGALRSFQAGQARGARCLYDLPIGYWRVGQRIYREEAEREPEWAGTLTGVRDSPRKLARKDAELELADAVFVASTFTQSTLAEAPGLTAPVHVVPYGAPPPVPRSAFERPGGKLRVLFAGSLTQRKGISYLLAALAPLGSQVELTLLGAKTGTCAPLEEALRRHRWIPSLPHGEVLREMARHDVLVFPSLFEGFGLVILEAMAQGLPVITTPHTAGPDIIEDGIDGFIVPIRDATAIAEKLELWVRDRTRLAAMSEAARATAARFSWASYRRRLVDAVSEVLEGNGASPEVNPSEVIR